MPQRKHRKRRSGRMIGFKAFADTDRDIIAWWDSLPPGQGSEILRTIIRDHLVSGDDDNLTVRQLEALRVDMNAQFRAVMQRIGQITAVSLPTPTQPDQPRLSPEEVQERKQAILKRRW